MNGNYRLIYSCTYLFNQLTNFLKPYINKLKSKLITLHFGYTMFLNFHRPHFYTLLGLWMCIILKKHRTMCKTERFCLCYRSIWINLKLHLHVLVVNLDGIHAVNTIILLPNHEWFHQLNTIDMANSNEWLLYWFNYRT